jgi:hypothetical protein
LVLKRVGFVWSQTTADQRKEDESKVGEISIGYEDFPVRHGDVYW